MSDYICPISFINEEPTTTRDLNELFIAGYRDKVCNDVGHSLLLDDIKNTFDFNNLTPSQNSWLNEISRYEYTAFDDAIISYLICNITDLTINTLILFMERLSMPNLMIDGNLDQLINEIDVRANVTDIVSKVFGGTFIRNDSPIQVFLSTDMKMNNIYSVLICNVFDAYVDKFVAAAANSEGGIKMLFETLYSLVYQSTEYPDATYSNMYTFCTAIIREAIDKETLMFRSGLKEIAKTAAMMITNSPKYGLNATNPDYVTSIDEYKDCGLFDPQIIEKEIKNELIGRKLDEEE